MQPQNATFLVIKKQKILALQMEPYVHNLRCQNGKKYHHCLIFYAKLEYDMLSIPKKNIRICTNCAHDVCLAAGCQVLMAKL